MERSLAWGGIFFFFPPPTFHLSRDSFLSPVLFFLFHFSSLDLQLLRNPAIPLAIRCGSVRGGFDERPGSEGNENHHTSLSYPSSVPLCTPTCPFWSREGREVSGRISGPNVSRINKEQLKVALGVADSGSRAPRGYMSLSVCLFPECFSYGKGQSIVVIRHTCSGFILHRKCFFLQFVKSWGWWGGGWDDRFACSLSTYKQTRGKWEWV